MLRISLMQSTPPLVLGRPTAGLAAVRTNYWMYVALCAMQTFGIELLLYTWHVWCCGFYKYIYVVIVPVLLVAW